MYNVMQNVNRGREPKSEIRGGLKWRGRSSKGKGTSCLAQSNRAGERGAQDQENYWEREELNGKGDYMRQELKEKGEEPKVKDQAMTYQKHKNSSSKIEKQENHDPVL